MHLDHIHISDPKKKRTSANPSMTIRANQKYLSFDQKREKSSKNTEVKKQTTKAVPGSPSGQETDSSTYHVMILIVGTRQVDRNNQYLMSCLECLVVYFSWKSGNHFDCIAPVKMRKEDKEEGIIKSFIKGY